MWYICTKNAYTPLGLQVPPQKVFGPSKPTPNTFLEGPWSPRDSVPAQRSETTRKPRPGARERGVCVCACVLEVRAPELVEVLQLFGRSSHWLFSISLSLDFSPIQST